METPSGSSSEGSNNKENINSNNVEGPKLGMEPMQTKRRKNGGGYNLRKSLAWDKAFFTDEGILDPLDLTLITGINNNTHVGRLATISEEGNSSFSSHTKYNNESEEVQASEESLHKELPKSRTLKGNTGKKVTQKVLSTHRTSRTESKVGGCREPLAASSLKRPANLNIMKTSKKESKLPKLPISKPGTCFSGTSKGSMIASQLRHDMIPKPTMNVQKNVGLKSSAKIVQGSESRPKTGPDSLPSPAKDPSKKPVRNMTKSSSKETSSTKSRSLQADNTNSGSEMIPDRLHLNEIQVGSTPLAAKNLAQHIETNLNNSLPQAARSTSSQLSHIQRASSSLMISDRLLPCESQELPAAPAVSYHKDLCNTGAYPPNTQPARPSGLRPPSRSLRFFDQRTTLETGLWQQKKVQRYNDNMDYNRKIGELRPPKLPVGTPMKSNDITETICSVVPTSSEQWSALSTRADTCLQSLEIGVDVETCSLKSWEMGIAIGSVSEKSVVAEESRHPCDSILEANPTVQGCSDGLKTSSSQFQSENQTLEGEESRSLSRKVAGSMLEEKPIMYGEYVKIGRVLADNDQVCMKDCLSPKKIANLEEPNSVVFVPEQSISFEFDLRNSSANAQISPISGEFRIGADGSKISFGEEVANEGLQERNSRMVGEFQRELDDGSGLNKNNDATTLIKRSNSIKKQDNSLVIHLPNAVPFSDEWLAAIEAAGEEILTMKCGAVQHSPPDKSLPEPSPWSPVKKKANQIGPYDCTKHTNAMPSNP